MKVVLTFLLAAMSVWAQEAHSEIALVPSHAAPIVDVSGVLSDVRESLDAKLIQLRNETGAEVSVLVMPSIGDEAIEQYSIRVVDQWKLGRAGIDDGALLLVALKERQLRIEVGRGLEGDIPDAIAKRIIAEQITPYFQQGQISAGVNAGVDALASLIRKTGLPPPQKQKDTTSMVLIVIVGLFLLGSLLASIFGSIAGATGAGALGILAGILVSSFIPALGIGALIWFLVFFRNPILQALMHAQMGNGGRSYGGGRSGGSSWGSGGGFSGGGASGRW